MAETSPTDLKAIGNRLIELRSALGHTQAAMARLIGVTPSHLFNWEQGYNRPSIDAAFKLDSLTQAHEVRWHWVKGHAGTEANERADRLAREGMTLFKKKKKKHKPAKPPEQAGSGST